MTFAAPGAAHALRPLGPSLSLQAPLPRGSVRLCPELRGSGRPGFPLSLQPQLRQGQCARHPATRGSADQPSRGPATCSERPCCTLGLPWTIHPSLLPRVPHRRGPQGPPGAGPGSNCRCAPHGLTSSPGGWQPRYHQPHQGSDLPMTPPAPSPDRRS